MVVLEWSTAASGNSITSYASQLIQQEYAETGQMVEVVLGPNGIPDNFCVGTSSPISIWTKSLSNLNIPIHLNLRYLTNVSIMDNCFLGNNYNNIKKLTVPGSCKAFYEAFIPNKITVLDFSFISGDCEFPRYKNTLDYPYSMFFKDYAPQLLTIIFPRNNNYNWIKSYSKTPYIVEGSAISRFEGWLRLKGDFSHCFKNGNLEYIEKIVLVQGGNNISTNPTILENGFVENKKLKTVGEYCYEFDNTVTFYYVADPSKSKEYATNWSLGSVDSGVFSKCTSLESIAFSGNNAVIPISRARDYTGIKTNYDEFPGILSLSSIKLSPISSKLKITILGPAIDERLILNPKMVGAASYYDNSGSSASGNGQKTVKVKKSDANLKFLFECFGSDDIFGAKISEDHSTLSLGVSPFSLPSLGADGTVKLQENADYSYLQDIFENKNGFEFQDKTLSFKTTKKSNTIITNGSVAEMIVDSINYFFNDYGNVQARNSSTDSVFQNGFNGFGFGFKINFTGSLDLNKYFYLDFFANSNSKSGSTPSRLCIYILKKDSSGNFTVLGSSNQISTDYFSDSGSSGGFGGGGYEEDGGYGGGGYGGGSNYSKSNSFVLCRRLTIPPIGQTLYSDDGNEYYLFFDPQKSSNNIDYNLFFNFCSKWDWNQTTNMGISNSNYYNESNCTTFMAKKSGDNFNNIVYLPLKMYWVLYN